MVACDQLTDTVPNAYVDPCPTRSCTTARAPRRRSAKPSSEGPPHNQRWLRGGPRRHLACFVAESIVVEAGRPAAQFDVDEDVGVGG